MGAIRKVAPKRHKQTRRWIMLLCVLVIIITVLTAAYFWSPIKDKPPTDNQVNPANADPAFSAFTSQYLDVMKSLNASQTKAKMSPLLSPSYNQTALFTWEGSKLVFASDPAGSFIDPFQILERGEGVCLQWSIVYVSACLALGYQARLVVAVDTSGWSWIHVWVEDYYNGTWVHVDPSDKVWNQPQKYLSWDWGPYIGSTVKVFAFEDARYQDVTSAYSANSN